MTVTEPSSIIRLVRRHVFTGRRMIPLRCRCFQLPMVHTMDQKFRQFIHDLPFPFWNIGKLVDDKVTNCLMGEIV